MADVKISQMPLATTLKDTDFFEIVQDGQNKKIQGALIKGSGVTAPPKTSTTLDSYSGNTYTEKLKNMINDITNNKINDAMLITFPDGVIEITESLCIKGWNNKTIVCNGALYFNNCHALEFKELLHCDVHINRVASVSTGLISPTSVANLTKRGIKISDCSYNRFSFNQIVGFTNGLEIYSEYGAKGCFYLDLFLNAIWRCKQAMKIYNGKASDDTSSQPGWITEISVYSGMIDCNDGVVIGQEVGSRPSNEPNDNYQGLKFYNFGIEHIRLKGQGVGFNFLQGKNNAIINPRFEGSLKAGNSTSGAYILVKESIYAWNNRIETSNYPINMDRVILNHSAKQDNGNDCICGSYITGDLRNASDGRIGSKAIATPGKMLYEAHNLPSYYFTTFAKPNTINYICGTNEFAKVKDSDGNVRTVAYSN